jgi:predicted nucleic acid-binding protein
MILLDTNVLSELMKAAPDAGVVAWVDEQPTRTLFISAITRAEIEWGIALLPEGNANRRLRQQLKPCLKPLPIGSLFLARWRLFSTGS